MLVRSVYAKKLKNSRGEETIEVIVKTEKGVVNASAPFGKSRGIHEANAFVENVEHDVRIINALDVRVLDIKHRLDIIYVEKKLRGKIGANSMLALQLALLKALAKKQGCELWQLFTRRFKPVRMLGNVIGGGMHSSARKPEFQEFLFSPRTRHMGKAVLINKKVYSIARSLLKKYDPRFKGKKNDENAWETTLNNEQVLEIANLVREKVKERYGENVDIGIDIAASTFYDKRSKKYVYENVKLRKQEQINFVARLAKKFSLLYLEDPLHEEDFDGFAILRKKLKKILVVGDDLTVTNTERLKKAIKKKAISGIIVKPNQIGSLIASEEVVELAKRHGIAVIVSHRSGETLETGIADLAIGWHADFVKFGVAGKEREVKLKRLIEIEKKAGV